MSAKAKPTARREVFGRNVAPPRPVAPTATPKASPESHTAAKDAPAVIETPTVDGSINLTGARFDDLRLRQYRETPAPRSPEIELLSPMAAQNPYVADFGWIAGQGETQALPNADTVWQLSQAVVEAMCWAPLPAASVPLWQL